METQNPPNWTNTSNTSFYNQIGFDGLFKTSEIAGVDTYIDVEKIYNKINNADHILDVGAAYGRVESYLLSQAFQGTITAIEKSESLFECLEQKYGQQVNCLNEDIMLYEPNSHFDAILCMFSVITDFPYTEQFNFIKKLKSLLSNKPAACIILESFPQGKVPLNCKTEDRKNYEASFNGETLRGYLPSKAEMASYAQKLSMKLEVIPYQTTTKRDRVLYIFTH